MKLAIVTATTDLERAVSCIASWRTMAVTNPRLSVALNGPRASEQCGWLSLQKPMVGTDYIYTSQDYLGTVPAFCRGVELAMADRPDVIAALHDDLLINEPSWDDKVLEHFRRHPKCGLAGFGGAIGLGTDNIYQAPYDPMQLARIGFRSNLVDAESHGIRSTLPERVACLDSFSMIFRSEFAEKAWRWMEQAGIKHHFHDGAAACLAAREGWEVWYLPVACQHLGGRTAVGDQGYQEWAKQQTPQGDQGFWLHAHKVCYEAFKDVLPIRV
jgi:hypothetical protein